MLRNDLIQALQSHKISAHMPGHKHVDLHTHTWHSLDTTEVQGTDNLHQAGGIIKKAQDRAAALYGVKKTQFLVGGSTVGILAAIMGACQAGDTLLIGRDCHKSVYHAMELAGVTGQTVLPHFKDSGVIAGYQEDQVINHLKAHPHIKVVVLTSPSYYGYTSPLKAIRKLLDQRQGLLIIDEAHGAHLALCNQRHDSAVDQAHIIIQSAHKMLPAMTQTGLIHYNIEGPVEEAIGKYLGMLQSSSPSYVLLTSIDDALSHMADNKSHHLAMMDHLKTIRCDLKTWCDPQAPQDPTKIWLWTGPMGYTGYEIEKILVSQGIVPEFSHQSGVLLYMSTLNTPQDLATIKAVVLAIPQRPALKAQPLVYPQPQQVVDLSKVKDYGTIALDLDQTLNATCAERVIPYPPGIPLVMPGERITQDHITLLKQLKDQGHPVLGVADPSLKTLKTLKE